MATYPELGGLTLQDFHAEQSNWDNKRMIECDDIEKNFSPLLEAAAHTHNTRQSYDDAKRQTHCRCQPGIERARQGAKR